MSEQVIIDGELNLNSAFDGLPNEQIVVNVTGAPPVMHQSYTHTAVTQETPDNTEETPDETEE